MRRDRNLGRKAYGILLVLAILSWAVIDYVTLPAYNFQSFGFWTLLAIYVAVIGFLVGKLLGLEKAPVVAVGCGVLAIAIAFLASAASWLVWPGNAKRYYSQLEVSDREASLFSKDFPDEGSLAAVPAAAGSADLMILPRTDKQLSIAIGQGKLGTYGARFRMDENTFTALGVDRGNGKTDIVRVSPLDYTGFMVALTGGSRGTAGYIEVDQQTEEGRLVQVDGGMKYTPGAVFGYDLDRRLRFRYRGLLFGTKSFEIDDSGKPWWVVPVIRNTVGLFGGPDAAGIVLVDPVSGETERFARGEEPAWVDRVIPSDIVITQANNHLRLKDGWFNALFGQKRDVFQLSDSYNYVVTRGPEGLRTWLVSGVTSPSESDQTMAGFMLVNLKTKEARRYAMSGITEMRAMEIAQSDERVRAQSLEATWPILVDLGGEPAYYLFLKNAVQRQRFVYVDLATGQKVAMGETMAEARDQYARKASAGMGSTSETASVSGTVLRVKDSAEDASVLFILQGQPDILYTASSALSNDVRFLAPGDKVEVSYRELAATSGQRFVVGLVNRSLGR